MLGKIPGVILNTRPLPDDRCCSDILACATKRFNNIDKKLVDPESVKSAEKAMNRKIKQQDV